MEETRLLLSTRRSRVIHVTTVPETLRFLSGQIGFLRSCGCDASVVSSPGSLLEEFARAENVSAFGVEMPRRITPFRDLAAVFRLWRHFRQERPTVVHAHTPKGGLLGMIAGWLSGTPVRIYHIRGLPLVTATGFRRRLLTWTEKVSCRLAHRVFAVSHSMRELAISQGLCPAEKLCTPLAGSGNGVNAAERFNPQKLRQTVREEVRSQYDIPRDALVVGFVGRIVQDKGIVELVEAWRLLREQFPNLHLLMVGHFEPQDPVPSSTEQALRRDPRVHLTGTQWNTPPFYAAMDLVVLPTYREGFPNVPLEAAAMERPVVASHVPGCTDAVEDGVTGVLTPVKNAPLLAEAIARYLQNPQLRRAHGLAGRRRVLRQFRPEEIWSAVWNEYLDLFRRRGIAAPERVTWPRKAA